MSLPVKALKALADPTRLRLLALLDRSELSVHELQEITRMGQSRISSHLRLLEQTGFLRRRKEGKHAYYRLDKSADGLTPFLRVALEAAKALDCRTADLAGLRRVLRERQDPTMAYFRRVAGRFGRTYGPGRSWQAFAQMLLRLLPPIDVADLGAGEGLLSELMARRCRKVIAVDNSPKMVAYGRRKARRNRIPNLEFRLGDLQDPPIEDASVDAAVLSQALHHAEDPAQALRSAWRILRPSGQVVVLDLLQHQFEAAREVYGDRWLGFSESELAQWLEGAGFEDIEIATVAREEQPPHFQTVLAAGRKPSR